MNHWVYIFAFYLLGITIVPCADAIAQTSDSLEHLVELPDDHHEEHNDLCSPFCQCQCCQIHIQLHPDIAINLTYSQISTIIVSHHSGISSDYSLGILDPPRRNFSL